ncbi:MAG: hypothetical protein GTO24_07750 [candidate division Zixibacteria bacterium]|nr:hypothetical protein [candidate division Zixibacteria bacterium]
MKNIKLAAVLIIFVLFSGFMVSQVSGEEIPSGWCTRIDGGIYHMISFPYLPEDGDVLGQLVDDLGPYDPTKWRLFRYDPAQFSYIERPEKFDFGWGYWIISGNTTEICVEGEPAGINWIVLQHEGDGWNQIGNIFDYDFPIVGLYVARESDPANIVQLIDPVNNDLTYVTLQEFEDGSYVDVPNNGKDHLEVGKGYWLRVREDVGEDVYLGFVATESSALSKGILLSQGFSERVVQQEDPPDPPSGLEVSFSSESDSGGVTCFFATALYRKYDHPHVLLLRKFRDRYLLANGFGRIFVNLYYGWSPTIARFVPQWEPIKILVRFTLIPIIALCALVSKCSMYGFLIGFIFPLFGSFFLLKRTIQTE